MTTTIHELKTVQPYFDAIWCGDKTFEIRENDRDYQVGDTLDLKEWDGDKFTGRTATRTVDYITTFMQQPGYVVMGWRAQVLPTPPTGAAEIEPAPARREDGLEARVREWGKEMELLSRIVEGNFRITGGQVTRIHERLTALEGIVKDQSSALANDNTRMNVAQRQITALEQQVAPLTERVEALSPKPECGRCAGYGTIKSGNEECPDCGGDGEHHEVPVHPQPDTADAADDASKWEAVAEELGTTFWHTYNVANHTSSPTLDAEEDAAKAAVAKAKEVGLVADPIDPSDERLVQVVMDALFKHRNEIYDSTKAKAILAALAEAQKEGRG